MLTASKQSKTGYWIESLGKNVYSLEEINYFIYNHINLVYRDFFNESLFEYIEKELDLSHMAKDLRSIEARDGTTQEFVKYILNRSFYYNGRELANISSLVANIDTMGRAERIKIQGDASFRAGNFNSALKCYLEILRNIGNENVSDSFYGRVAYAAGTIYAMMFMSKSANAFFSYAYDLSPDPLYAKACVYMSIISDDDEELLSSIVKYKISDDELDTIRRRVNATRREIESQDDMAVFLENIKVDDFAEQFVNECKAEYYNMLK